MKSMKIIKGLASTTHIDRNGDKLTKNALEMMCSKINKQYIPLDIEHSGNYVGVVLCAKVKELDDGEYGLYIVAGIFENMKDMKKYPYGSPNTVYKQYLPLLDEGGN